MKKKNWKEELKEVIKEHSTFGHNCEYYPSEVIAYCKKLEKLGGSEIHIPDNETIKLELPALCDTHNILLFILTNEFMRPSSSSYNKKKNILTLTFAY